MMDQGLWNLLFGWLTGKQCMIPEGCNPPVTGIIIYTSAIIISVIGLYFLYERRET